MRKLGDREGLTAGSCVETVVERDRDLGGEALQGLHPISDQEGVCGQTC